MLGVRPIHRAVRPTVLAITAVLVILLASLGLPVSSGAQTGQSGVTLEWLGHEFYRITSPQGVVVLTSPWLDNPDGPIDVAELARTDLVLVPNAHNDDRGTPMGVAGAPGATVMAPGPLGNWLVENGPPRSHFFQTNMGGGKVSRNDPTIKVGP